MDREHGPGSAADLRPGQHAGRARHDVRPALPDGVHRHAHEPVCGGDRQAGYGQGPQPPVHQEPVHGLGPRQAAVRRQLLQRLRDAAGSEGLPVADLAHGRAGHDAGAGRDEDREPAPARHREDAAGAVFVVGWHLQRARVRRQQSERAGRPREPELQRLRLDDALQPGAGPEAGHGRERHAVAHPAGAALRGLPRVPLRGAHAHAAGGAGGRDESVLGGEEAGRQSVGRAAPVGLGRVPDLGGLGA